ncbi:hypothetical protein LTR37_013193 [Vermiconidia calcicola]|uniref:Uncharacterized protein n=1 Tax=Vermiconidia calcicola TaxID=1690605 RepID=A0ACC3MWW7_9PEZI|nr:hypothetical protein LTR37_013193 [Vermiconidia calcicola]
MDQYGLMKALTACILFAAFESSSGNRDGAIPHVVHSRKLVEQYRRTDDDRHAQSDQLDAFPIGLDVIEPLVAHYEVQVGEFNHEEHPEGMINTFDLSGKLTFQRLADARASLELAIGNLSILCMTMLDCDTAEYSAAMTQKRKYSAWLLDWDRAFSSYLVRNREDLDGPTMAGCRLLKAHQVAGLILAGADQAQGEEAWETFTPEFKVIVDLISEIVQSLPKRSVASEAPHTPYLSTSMGMTEPLYVAATRCADPVIADQARTLLTKLPLSEGAHSSWKVSFIEQTLCAATGKQYCPAPSTSSTSVSSPVP